MDLEYDRKFEEMKKYIPFLESMIKRLETTNNGVKNPRKAQLDKIRSLRDLLLDKKKRMKMENLLKCEQVLVNLYAKVEQRDLMTDDKEDCIDKNQKEKTDLNIVRNKLKCVASKLQKDDPDTLPEIARASNTEVVCTPGSKEPALFQRRPNKASPRSSSSGSHNEDNLSNNKRHYTRILMSPEHKSKEWLSNSNDNAEKALFSRRSPRRSPRSFSPSYKKERKKSSKQRSKSSQHSEDLNITLKVPQESLGSLNTKDILSRIINCSDNDVDIDTLRGLRSQILGELKQTGTKDDISDLILKSYKKKEISCKRKDEVEEGELSDSESETIENVYGSLVVVNQGESSSNTNQISNDKKQPRKIQICLVINSDKEKNSNFDDQTLNTTLDITDFEAYSEAKTASNVISETTGDKNIKDTTKAINNKEKDMSVEEIKSSTKGVEESNQSSKTNTKTENMQNLSQEKQKTKTSSIETFKPNFYQPVTEEKAKSDEINVNTCKYGEDIDTNSDKATIKPEEIVKNIRAADSVATVQVTKDVVSEIDILQALKNEILGETTAVPIPEAITPHLHQPKITKVASAQELVSKKRISIEKYKQKSAPSIKEPLFSSVKQQLSSKDDNSKKQSLKLTEKECERFNFPVNVSPVDSSEDEDRQRWDYEFLHETRKSSDSKKKDESHKVLQHFSGNSGPKSPDHEDFADTGIKPPVIIPSDPVKNMMPNAKADVDMRTLIPLISPVTLDDCKKIIASPSLNSEKTPEVTGNENINSNEKNKKYIPELVKRTEPTQLVTNNSPKPYLMEADKPPRSNTSYPNVSNIPPLMSLNLATHVTPSQNPNAASTINPIIPPIPKIPLLLTPVMAPNMTPNMPPGIALNMNPSMTPNRMIGINPIMTPILTPNARSYEMTPRPNFDIDDYTNQKHVYAPIFPTFEPHDLSENDNNTHKNKWENNEMMSLQRDHINRNERYMGDRRLDSPKNRLECPATPNPSFGRMECPSTPNPAFGRVDCPPTPNPSFGRIECPPTPNQTFGRMECPPTPNPAFGRMDCPLTPNPSFGRMETPMTPVHSFGRPDSNMIVFGRNDSHHQTSTLSHKYTKSQDPRLNRSTEYDKYQGRNDERKRLNFEDDRKMMDSSNSYRRSHVKSYEQDRRNSSERMPRRESSVGRSLSRDFEHDGSYTKDNYSNDYYYRREKYYHAKSMTRVNPSEENYPAQRDRGVSRMHTKEGSIEKPILVKSHTGSSFNIDTSFNRTFQETKTSSLNNSFDARRQRASSVGRSLHVNSNPTSINKNKFELDIPNNKDLRFRRACSVGRDLKGYNSDKNLKDIKEDLRSYKFNKYDFNSRDRATNSKSRINFTSEKNISNEYHNNRNKSMSITTFTKSTEHQSDRDPRRRIRDYDSRNFQSDDGSKYSPRKNFRDPRMRRELDVKYINKDRYKNNDRNSRSSKYENYGIVYSNDNIAKGTILASAAGVKNFKIPKIKRPLKEKEVEANNQNESDTKKEIVSVKDAKVENKVSDQSMKAESKSKKSEPSAADKCRDVENISQDVVIKEIKLKPKEKLLSCNKTENNVNSYDDNTDVVNSVSENSERRVTRSSMRRGIQVKEISRSPTVKKLRRIKKPLVYDSDSDSYEIDNNKERAKKNLDVNKIVQDTEHTEETRESSPYVDKRKIELSPTITEVDVKQHEDSIDSMRENSTINNSCPDNNTLESIEKITTPIVTNNSCEEQNDSLDINFGVDDELFPDNIAPDTVLTDYDFRALIAGLEHDIEAPKINDKFINNIVEDISSNDSLIPLVRNENDFTSDVTITENPGFIINAKNAKNSNNYQIDSSTDEQDTFKVTVSNNNPERINVVTQSEQTCIKNSSNEKKDDKTKYPKTSIEQSNEKNVSGECSQNNSELEENTKNIYTDAIVSTTACDEKSDEIPKESNCLTNKLVSTVYPSIPDSTNNLNEKNIKINEKDSEESVPDSTNELSLDINITSTNDSSDNLSKEQQSATTSISADDLPRINSISKLLSILEDKNKIKELLTLLSNDSGENEKIKKKLEKLSEIVSDEEETPSSANIRENDIITKKNHEKCHDVTVEQQLCSETKERDEKKSAVESTMPSQTGDNGQKCNDDSITVKEQSDIDKYIDEDNQNANIDKEDGYSKDTAIEIKENLAVKNIKDNNIKDAVQEDSVSESNETKNQTVDTLPAQPGKKIARKSKITKKGRSRLAKKLALNKDKRITQSEAGDSQPQISVPKKPSRELLKLQEDIRDMFISEDILNATGIRMCRLAKLVNGKNSKGDAANNEVEPEPIVVLENIKSKMSPNAILNSAETNNKNKTPKSKCNETSVDLKIKGKPRYKPGPKSKTKNQDDPYSFETESMGESNNTVDSKDQNTDSDSDSVSDSTKSFESSELLIEIKKKTKRKRRSWQLGVIKKKSNKSKLAMKNSEFSVATTEEVDKEERKDTNLHKIPDTQELKDKNLHEIPDTEETKDKNLHTIPDLNCFTDKTYCFHKNIKTYLCRLCGYRGNDIVTHYKKNHPHSEIPLSRLSPAIAKEAIEQCENMNLQAISKIQTMKYVCRFCFQEFHRQSTALETFFWHVVSRHTGEYKHLCSECINFTRCPFHLDIPPPPKNVKGQLIGYICGRCNFTQVSLENLKTHVINRHDDEQTEVYSINLGEIPRKVLQSLISKVNENTDECLRVLRSTRSNQSISEPSDDHSDMTDCTDGMSLDSARNLVQENSISKSKIATKNKIQSKLIFENDDVPSSSKSEEILKASIKLERDVEDQHLQHNNDIQETLKPGSETQQTHIDDADKTVAQTELTQSTDVLDYPHFKIKLTGTGSKEYICCINGNHYKTTLLISFKKHVQLKHSETWDGFCFVCRVIVTGQGKHNFKDCLDHFLDKHIDNFPILEEISEPIKNSEPINTVPVKDAPISKPYINVRPLTELISSEQSKTQEENPSMPKIKSVVSLGVSDVAINSETQKKEKVYNYEVAQAEVMTKKHRVVLEAMLSSDKLIQVFKCAGRFCSYTTDNAEEALVHASTHQRIGGEWSLKCAYCDFDSSGNAIDLVMHVFKSYSHCSFTCSKCFYRAAASQLVYAHIKRVHTELDADKVPVLSSATVMADNTKDDLLSRDAAVLYYVCNNHDPDEGGICQFKSYVLTKFREHLQIRHANDQEYSCYICKITTTSSKLLAQHLKSHGLRIYQCCRCLFGADNESELMAHASEKHPLKQPKAYLRIVTSKGGSSEVRVLPLAVLSKSTVETTVVTPSVDKESPVKQAERSIDLEKLIGQTNLMIESMSTMTNAATIEPVDVAVNERRVQLESEIDSCSDSQAESNNTSAILTLLKQPQKPTTKPNVKIEPVETEKPSSETISVASVALKAGRTSDDSDVVCLDSDEDILRSNIIDLSGEDIPAELDVRKKQEEIADVKIPRSRLYKCSKCALVSKREGMFKRHIISCFPNPNESVKCVFCSYTTTANKIVIHYNNNHLESSVPYICAICNGKFVSLAVAQKHMKLIHNEVKTIVNSKMSATGNLLHYVIDSDFKERQAPKRKLSSEIGNKSSEPAPKLKKFGPQDIDKLPINPILDELVYCSLCEFSTKVRLNMVRHLQLHAEQQPVPRTAPINPVPHLESNEKHFDKMLNLASSSITTANKTSKDGTIIVCENLSPDAASAYPKYVPDKHRYTCGAKGCSYISVNESMFKIHWETLHTGTNDYHCVHCPAHEHLDSSKPLTAVRIIAHLKMHDVKLYACSSCTFYHYTRKVIEKHLKEVHSGKLIIVREEGVALPPNPAPVQSSNAPTMDLKPWQCGLCKFKSMIRPEVIEHCGKFHQSKMQYKCSYCGFRTSNIENISKHQSKQHAGKKEEVFYFYYQEGSIPDDADGIAHWQKQSQKNESAIKTEKDASPIDSVPILPKPVPTKPSNIVNLDIVKKEIIEPEVNTSSEGYMEDLCNSFGQFCDPNGLKYKCSLCKVVIEDTKEAMQSHLYEELQYRKWGCAICSYKAFHKPGLQQHVQTEHGHRQDAREPIELQVDHRIERWVTQLLEHQTAIIEKYKENLAKQKAEILRATPGSSAKVAEKPIEQLTSSAGKTNMSMATLEKLFGPFGVPNNMNYTCPKCNISARAESVMQEHLEDELSKIRWCCNVCSNAFHTYHEAQFHCRSVHAQSSRPMEVTRDVSVRAAWVAAVLRVQKLSMNYMPVTETITPNPPAPPPPTGASPENSLLVVRYEQKVPTPEEQMKLNNKSDTDDEKMSTDESEKKKPTDFECKYCSATYKYENFFQGHVLKHYGLKPFTCPYCTHTNHRRMIDAHIKSQHPNRTVIYLNTPIPLHPPSLDHIKSTTSSTKPVSAESETEIICLGCEEAMTRAESRTHLHDNVRSQFAIKGSVVYRCWTCLTLHKTSNDFNIHHRQFHPSEKKNSSFYKLQEDSRTLFCSTCNQNFGNMAQYRAHQQTKHGLKSYASSEPSDSNKVIEIDDEIEVGEKRKAEDTTILPVPKRVAKKSTTKLPTVVAVARKSTTKLPLNAPCDGEEYSYYGTKPSMENLENVTTKMPFYNTFVPFTIEKLRKIIKIEPRVIVKDINDKK